MKSFTDPNCLHFVQRHILSPTVRLKTSKCNRIFNTKQWFQIPTRSYFSDNILDQLDKLKTHHASLEQKLANNQVIPSELASVSREYAELSRAVEVIHELEVKRAEANDLQDIISENNNSPEGKEITEMAQEELSEIQPEIEALEQRVKRILLPRDEADRRDAIVEVRAGTGGEEASLFTAEIFNMYEQYARSSGWEFSTLDIQTSTEDGMKEGSAEISGPGVFGRLKYEIGTHRVQRVPQTESGGRLHTSAMTVAVLPKAEEVDIDIKPSDLRIDTFRAQGAGGQHVNTTDSAVRITHIPTNTVVSCQNERSQHRNKARAMAMLRSRIFEQQRQQRQQEQVAMRRAQIGSGDRSERIRTYNFAQDRITDHRVGMSKFGIAQMMRGEMLDEFWDALKTAEEDDMLAQLENQTS